MRPWSILLGATLWFCFTVAAVAQRHRPSPQQDVHYVIDVTLDPRARLLTGAETIVYINRSADTLAELYLNLYVNAFRRNSRMEAYQAERYRAHGGSILSYLREPYLGYQEISDVRDGAGTELPYEYDDTLVRILLAEPLAPNSTVTLRLRFELKVPWLIRRMGWQNREGIEFTMAQWYPKVCVYDANGWHKAYYVGREFYGEFGTYDVTITLPPQYVVGATGQLMNAAGIEDMMRRNPIETRRMDEDGVAQDTGRQDFSGLANSLAGMNERMRDTLPMRTWQFHAQNVHDFAWCADPDYVVESMECDGVRLHFLYQPDVAGLWDKMKEWSCDLLRMMQNQVGPYAYRDFTIAQAGDGGMEYPGIVFITGHRGPFSLASVTAHEMAHNWFYGMLGNDESMEAWLDEGITSFYTTRLMEQLFGRYAMTEYESPFKARYYPKQDAREATFAAYEWWARQGYEEKVLTQADDFADDKSYQMAAYYKGQIFMFQLQYVFGEERLDSLMRLFFETWRLHHVSTGDFKRFLEKETGCELDWLFEAWLHTTDHCDYAVAGVNGKWITEGGQRYYDAVIRLERHGPMAMPLDVYVKLKNDSLRAYRIPAHTDDPDIDGLERRPTWVAGVTSYDLQLELEAAIEWVHLDTSLRLCDVNRMNNRSGVLPEMEWRWQRPVPPYPALDKYVIEHRPSVWYNGPDGLRIGYRAKGKWATDDHRIGAGIYTGIRSAEPDYEISYVTPVYGLGRQTTLSLESYRLEGRTLNSLGLSKKSFSQTWDRPPIHDVSIQYRHSRLVDSAYIPPGQAWDRQTVSTLILSWRRQSRLYDSPLFQASVETSFFGPGRGFSKILATYKFPWMVRRRVATLWIRSTAGYAIGHVPVQDRFYLAGASPREMFENRFYRSKGTIPSGAWLQDGRRHFYYDGGGSMAGYFDANPSGRRMAAVNLNLEIGNPFKWMFNWNTTWATSWEPCLFYDAGLTWKKDSELKRLRQRLLMDAGAGLRYPLFFIPGWWGRYALRFDAPVWINKPSINGDSRQLAARWMFGLDRVW